MNLTSIKKSRTQLWIFTPLEYEAYVALEIAQKTLDQKYRITALRHESPYVCTNHKSSCSSHWLGNLHDCILRCLYSLQRTQSKNLCLGRVAPTWEGPARSKRIRDWNPGSSIFVNPHLFSPSIILHYPTLSLTTECCYKLLQHSAEGLPQDKSTLGGTSQCYWRIVLKSKHFVPLCLLVLWSWRIFVEFVFHFTSVSLPML